MNYWKFPLVCIAGAVLAVASCSHPPGSGTTSGAGGANGSGGTGSTCSGGPGTLGCPCNGTTCDQGLACANTGNGQNECVSTGSGTGGTTGSGGDTGSGGSVASGGSTGSGGSSSGGATGSGGNASTGGSMGSGGSSSGGTTGAGGSPGNNLVVNGDFSQGMANWGIPNGNPMNPTYNSQFCMTISSSGGQVIVGWGDDSVSANLQANVNYTLSLQASASSPLSGFDTHVGSAVQVPAGSNNYPLDDDLGNDNIGNSLQTFTHQFSLSNADPHAGLAFLISASSGSPMVCIDNVSLTAN